MTLSRRLRLTLAVSAYAGLLLGALFAAAVMLARTSEVESAHRLMLPALRQVEESVRHGGGDRLDLDEITASEPELSLFVFTLDGRLVRASGPLRLEPGMTDGKQRIGNIDVIIASDKTDTLHLVAALPWRSREAAIERLAWLLCLLWLPLVAGAAFVTWESSRATFAPLFDLTRQAEQMREADASLRLVVPGNDEYAVFARSLNGFLERLETSLRQQERFVADAAHELRTPLTVLRGRIETTLRHARSDADYRSALQEVLGEAERLSVLAELLLQSAAPTLGSLPEVDLAVAAERAHARWVDRFSQREVELQIETQPALVHILEPEIDVVLDNLLSNALRVSPDGAHCSIETFVENSCAVVRVTDQGPGVPPELAERIFGHFFRGDDSRNRSQGGFGVGLAVSRRLLDWRGGTIALENPGAPGATFRVTLPKVDSPPP